MYKKPNGKTGFSIGRLITNAVPNFALDNAKDDAEFGPNGQDALFAHQMRLENPKVFNDLSLFASGTVDAKSYSRSVLNDLKRVGIVNKTDGSIHTELITKHFPNQVPIISIHKQRRLIGLLFFWEEELTRWRLLDEEEAEIRKAMERDGGEENEALKVALGTVSVRRSTPPSLRGRDGSISGPGASGNGGGSGSSDGGRRHEEPPPDYYDVTRTVSICGGNHHNAEGGSSAGPEGAPGPSIDEKGVAR